ncbi:hypothetical protein V6G44_005199 [Burkholderia multivorans]|uniref:hypothetical protein n=1 Tax=Burkholderia multivorans TaxID=87883 RepID=UPI0011B29857|nr:hypothetical protein [Burkholderia multivorans]MCA8263659.1 hypothetical protein [Burkholderia multivorans]MCO1362340.1 hypothetical protein [Burkholderia multivorans]MCO1380726.1 hypothetical protein [Burkholderia multivorans]MCO1400840.1 hypothetical protein [Burkholderia multivorans]MCO1422111.1 hypothetical protein [Burkholderia multivorans]
MNLASIFSDNGNVEHLLGLAHEVPAPGFSGVWSTVELQPDIFVPQSFSVGIVVQPEGERLHFKLLDDFKKFECVYGNRFPQRSIREVMAYAEETLRLAAQSRKSISSIALETDVLRLSAPIFTSGENCEATIERLFADVIVMAPHSKHQGREFVSIDTARARTLVNHELKRIAQMDFEKIVVAEASSTGMLIEDKGIKHYLDFNLRTVNACGSVVSAVYKSPVSVELNLLKSSRDLTTYSRIKNLRNTGLFLLLPDEKLLGEKEYKYVVDVIDEQAWKLERDGFRVVSLSSEVELAQEIYDWALPTIG